MAVQDQGSSRSPWQNGMPNNKVERVLTRKHSGYPQEAKLAIPNAGNRAHVSETTGVRVYS